MCIENQFILKGFFAVVHLSYVGGPVLECLDIEIKSKYTFQYLILFGLG